MKNFILASAIACGIVIAGTSAFAQVSQSVTSTATVTTPITGGANAALAFGTVTKGVLADVEASAATAGSFFYSGDEADGVTITIPATATISTVSGATANMTVTLDRANMLAHNVNVQANATAADASSGSVTRTLSTDVLGDGVDADGLGQVYVWIGGSVTPSATQQRGAYSGTFNVSASYSN